MPPDKNHWGTSHNAFTNGVSEPLFKVGICLPAGPYVTDDDIRYIVDTIKPQSYKATIRDSHFASSSYGM